MKLNRVLASGLLLFVGCHASEEPKVDEISSEAILVSVNSDKLTKGDLDEYVQLMSDVDALSSAKGGVAQDKTDQWIRIALSGYVERMLFRQEARRLQIQVSEKECTDQIRYVLKLISVGKKTGREQTKVFDEAKLDKLRAQVRDELLAQKARTALVRNQVQPTEEELKFRFKQIEDYNKTAMMTNALVWARATNVWNQIKAGAKFEDLVKKYSEEEGDVGDGEWGDWSLADLEKGDADLARILPQMKVGEISAPVESDNGLAIIKVLAREEVEKKAEPGIEVRVKMEKDTQYKLARIFFKLPLMYAVPTKDELKRVVAEMKQSEAQERELNRLKKAADIRWPLGEDVAEKLIARRRAKVAQQNLPKEVRTRVPAKTKGEK